MAIITKSWIIDLPIFSAIILYGLYQSYGTWVFRIIAVGVGCVYIAFQYKYQHWKNYGFPYLCPIFPMGNLASIFWKAPGEVLRDLHDKGRGQRFIGVWFLFQPAIILRDPEIIKQVLVKEFVNFHERGVSLNKKNDPLMAHIFFLSGRKWRNTRTKLTPTFTSGKLKAMFPQFVEVANRFEAALAVMAEERLIVDVKELSARFATDLTTLTAFGIETDCITDPNNNFRKMGRKIFEPSFITVVRSVMPFLVPTLAGWLHLVTTPRDVTAFFQEAIKNVVDYREKNDIKRQDFLNILLELKRKGRLEDTGGFDLNLEGDDKELKFSFADLAAEAFVFFVAGYETAAVAISWAIYELAMNPELQTKTREEIHEKLKKFNGEMTYAGLQEMSYLDQVIEESLRMYPPVPLLVRQAHAPYRIPDTDVTIPAGSQVHISVHGLHRDPDNFDHPDVFDPDRFSPAEKLKRHHYTYLPFGEGPRNCIGMRYSMLQKKVGLITMLNKFAFSIVKESPAPLQFDTDSFVFTAKGGMMLQITKLD